MDGRRPFKWLTPTPFNGSRRPRLTAHADPFPFKRTPDPFQLTPDAVPTDALGVAVGTRLRPELSDLPLARR
eukprot:2164834-Prymnesium_polylepis.1